MGKLLAIDMEIRRNLDRKQLISCSERILSVYVYIKLYSIYPFGEAVGFMFSRFKRAITWDLTILAAFKVNFTVIAVFLLIFECCRNQVLF